MTTTVTRPAAACPDPLRYTRLPDALISELTPREHQLVHLLLSYRWTADALIYPSVTTLATRLHCSDRTIQRTLRALERRGYVVSVARFRSDTGQTSNEYRPGPLLVPLLSPPGDMRVPAPVTRMSGEREPRKNTNRNGGTGYERFDARNYYETSSGDLRVRG